VDPSEQDNRLEEEERSGRRRLERENQTGKKIECSAKQNRTGLIWDSKKIDFYYRKTRKRREK